MTIEHPDPRSARPCAAVLTADGRGAIAVVRVWGRHATDAASAAFRPMRGKPLSETPAGVLRLGRVGAGIGDEVVAFNTLDEPPEVELQCHGGPSAVALVLEALRAEGVEVVPAVAWAGRHGPARVTVDALMALAEAPTIRSAEVLLEQAEGAFEEELRRLDDALARHSDAATNHIDVLIERGRIGVRLRTGWRVVLAGRPNVGKSRLLNALAGFERAIVDATPGTTRDIVTVQTAIDGWPVELADTAGLRDTSDPIEVEGVARARARQHDADLIVLVLDRSEPLTTDDRALLSALPNALRVANKTDRPATWEGPLPGAFITVSAAFGDGIEDLIAEIGRRLVPVAAPRPGEGVPFRTEHLRSLHRARRLAAGKRFEAARRALKNAARTVRPG